MSAEIIHVDEKNFETVINQAQGPVVIDFWAEWCGPCKAIAPILDEVAREQQDAALIAKVNVDQNQALAQKYGIRGIPTLLFMKDGEVKKTLVGQQSKDVINQEINELK